MITPIILTDVETKTVYTLEFNRESIKYAEQNGFNIEEIETSPMTKVPELFFYAFRMHHRNISRTMTDNILFEKLGGATPKLLEKLAILYAEPFKTLFNDNEDEEKNAKMTVQL